MFQAASESSKAIECSPHDSDTKHCPFYTRFEVPVYEYYAQNPQKSKRFAQAMKAWSQGESNLFHVLSLCNFPPVYQPTMTRTRGNTLTLEVQWIAKLRNSEIVFLGSH